MSGDQIFQQRWGLRGRDDADSSSDESKSRSQEDHVLKKHRLHRNSELPENDEINNSPLLHHGNEIVPHKSFSSGYGTSGKKCKENLATEKQIKKRKKSDVKRKAKKMKNTRGKYKPISLDHLKMFTKSVIDELKVAREEMFARTNEEMGIISVVKSASRPGKKKVCIVDRVGQEQMKNKDESGKKDRKTNGTALNRSVKDCKTNSSKNSSEIFGDGVIPVRSDGPILQNEKTKGKSSNFPPKEPSYNFSDQMASSPYLSLPAVVSEPRAQDLIALSGKSGMNSGSAASRNDEMPPPGYFSGTQMSEQFQNISQMGFHNMGYFNQLRNRTSCTGFPVQGLRNGFSFSQATETSSRGNEMLGPRIDGGAMRFSGGNHGFLGRN